MLGATVLHCVAYGEERTNVKASDPEPGTQSGTVTMSRIRVCNSSDHLQKEKHQFMENVLMLILYQHCAFAFKLSGPAGWCFPSWGYGVPLEKAVCRYTHHLPSLRLPAKSEELLAGGRGREMAASTGALMPRPPVACGPAQTAGAAAFPVDSN